ncbi:MAG: serine hydrolase, partial [Clostridiales bacterium]|nr:serine hydrolase [Clostridiales bacterium]
TSRHHDSLSGKLYSDMNALLLKYIIEQASGLSFEGYLKKNIFTVLGMKETFSAVPEDRLRDCLNYNYEHRIMDNHYAIEKDAVPGTVHDPKARFLMKGGLGLQGHAGLFSSAQDMVCFAQGLLRGDLLGRGLLLEIGKNRTGLNAAGKYRQFMGYLCFSKSPVQHLSEVPEWMGSAAFGIAGYTGNHFAMDPELGVFDIMLGNRCHMRVSQIEPSEIAIETYNLSQEGAGLIRWPDGRLVKSSFRFVHQKDILIHEPVYHGLRHRGWL